MNRIVSGTGRVSALLRQGFGRRPFAFALAGAAAFVMLGAAVPAGAKSMVTAQVPGVSVSIKAGPVKFVGISNLRFRFGNVQFGTIQTRPRFATSVGHFVINRGPGQQRQVLMPDGIVYTCPPSGAYGGGYGVPLYDYRASRYAQRGYGYGFGAAPVVVEQPAQQDYVGTFNRPAGYAVVNSTETPRPTFQPRVVQIAGTPQMTGPMPVVHKPAGKNHIHIE